MSPSLQQDMQRELFLKKSIFTEQAKQKPEKELTAIAYALIH